MGHTIKISNPGIQSIDDSSWGSYMKFHLFSIRSQAIETSNEIKKDSVFLKWCATRKTRQSMLELWHNQTENLLSDLKIKVKSSNILDQEHYYLRAIKRYNNK